MSRCSQCGAEVPPQATFCPACGRPVERVPTGPAQPVSPGPHPGGVLSRLGVPTSLGTLLRSLSRWDVAALLGGAVGGGGWYYWSKLVVPDPRTPWLIALLPVLLVIFRQPLDRLLALLQPLKQKVPRLMLVGVGLALPYLVAHYFYQHGVREYPLARKSVLWGTLLSYVVMRIPQINPLAGRPGGPAPAWRASCWAWVFGLLALGCLVAVDPAFADDFKRTHYKDLQDGLRTDQWAEILAGSTGTVINALINGGLVFQRTHWPGGMPPVFRGPEATASTILARPPEPKTYTLDICTEPATRELKADDQDAIWIYARVLCNKPIPGTPSPGESAGITFKPSGADAAWLKPGDTLFQHERMTVKVQAWPPSAREARRLDPPQVSLTVSAVLDGEPVEVPVTLTLKTPGLRLELRAVDPRTGAAVTKANTDGRFRVLIRPEMTLYGERFEGGLNFKNPRPYSTYTPCDDPFFKELNVTKSGQTERIIEVWHGTRLETVSFPISSGQEQLGLRTKFHLASSPEMKRLPLAAGSTVNRTYQLPHGSRALPVYFTDDQKFAELFPDGVLPDRALKLTLRPSKIEVKADPPELPRLPVEPLPQDPDLPGPPRLFTARIQAKVLSADNQPVPGICIPEPQATANVLNYLLHHDWQLRLAFRPDQPGYNPLVLEAVDVNTQGLVLFSSADHYTVAPNGQVTHEPEALSANRDYYEYNHEQWCWNPGRYVFTVEQPTPTSPKPELEARFDVEGTDSEGRATIAIGRQVPSAQWSWDYSGFYLSRGSFVHDDRGTTSYQWLKDHVLTPLPAARIPGSPAYTLKGTFYGLVPQPGVTQPLERTFPLHTILVKDSEHHGIVIQSNAHGVIIAHLLQKAGLLAQGRWLNRDQVRVMEKDAKGRLGRGAGVPIGDFSEARVYYDDLDTFLRRGWRAVRTVDVWCPKP